MANNTTQFSELQKLLINVADSKCDAFIKAHVNNTWPDEPDAERPSELPDFTAGENDKYYDKVVFLKKYNTIYTKGTFFGNTWDLQNSISANGITVKYDPDKNKIVTTVKAAEYDKDNDTWKNIDNVVTASEVQTYVDTKVAGAVAEATAAMNYCGPITEATFNTEKSKASNGDVYVVEGNFTIGIGNNAEKVEDGDLIIFAKDGDADATYTVVQKNLDGAVVKDGNLTASKIVVASGTGKVKTTDYGIGGNTFATTGSYVATEAGVKEYVTSAINAIDHTGATYTGNYISYEYHTANGITYIDNITPTIATAGISDGFLGGISAGLVDHNALNTVIEYLDGKIDAVDCEVTTLTEVSDSDYFSVTEDSTDKTDNDRNYKIELNVVSLGDAVGMTYDEATGKWSAPEGSTAVNGLASAADVANELVSDEKVIAAALNDHEARIDTLEDFVGDIDNTIQTQLEIGEVKVDGLKAEVTTAGLVNAQLLVDVINALDPWEDYE